ncbi:MAG: CpaF family protein [Actinomycetota bacterium]
MGVVCCLPPLLEHLLTRPDVTDVLVNGGTDIWVEADGVLHRAGSLAPGEIEASLERVLAPLGRRLDRLSPSIDARLPDGTRICAVVPPIATDGPAVALRVLRHRRCDIADFVDDPLVEREVIDLVASRANILVSGATGAGKTTLIAAITDSIRHSERLIVLEDTKEIVTTHPHCLRLEARPPTPDGRGEVTLDDLLRTALRLRPDRLVLGEIRDREAITLLNALNTGHSGSLASIHANSAADARRRLELLVTRLVPGILTARELVTTAIDVVVHVTRGTDGRRRIVDIARTS